MRGVKISVVGGAGRAGLPLALTLAEAGHQVIIIDQDEAKVSCINDGVMPFFEENAEASLRNSIGRNLIAVTELHKVMGCDVCLMIIGTPVNDDGSPSTDNLLQVVSNLAPFLDSSKLLMLRSTVYPGITDEIDSLLLNLGVEISVSFCPERIAEGVALHEMKSLPQIIGASTPTAFQLSEEVFGGISPKFVRTTIKEAEISKLFTNTYRYFKFAIANEFFKICVDSGINWENVWNSIKDDYPRGKDLPFPGFAAGPCLVKDTMQLDYFTKDNFSLGKESIKTNETLPDYIIEILKNRFDLANMTVGILGMTFKAEIDDFRSSLSFPLEEKLGLIAKKVLCSDEMLQKNEFVSAEYLVSASDLVIIATPHSRYAELIIEVPLVDIWRINSRESIL